MDTGLTIEEKIRLLDEQLKLSNTPLELLPDKQLQALGGRAFILKTLGRVSEATDKYLDMFITKDPAMLQLKQDVKQLVDVEDAVLIQGPTGTGKEILARALHGNRSEFVAVNCSAISEQLFESELFGHVKGSFTGATGNRKGWLRAADKGTLFLDEIGDMPYVMQAKLLRVIQERKARAVGSEEEYDVTCRFIAATHKELKPDVFREDLFFRISTFILRTTPLKDRPEDAKLILKSLGITHEVQLDDMPGNVRSLQRMARQLKVLGRIM